MTNVVLALWGEFESWEQFDLQEIQNQIRKGDMTSNHTTSPFNCFDDKKSSTNLDKVSSHENFPAHGMAERNMSYY